MLPKMTRKEKNKSGRKSKRENGGNSCRAPSSEPRGEEAQAHGESACRWLNCRHVVLFGCILLTYTYTVHPSIPGGDAGELLAEACQLGIPHPPGYPLLTILHYLLSRLVQVGMSPVHDPPDGCADSTQGRVALTANLLSAVLGAATAVTISMATEEWTFGSTIAYSPPAAAAGAVLFCLSPVAWEYNTGSEVFALNNVLVATALVIVAKIARRPSAKNARIGVAVFGLAIANQHAAILVLAPLSTFALWFLNKESLLSGRSMVAWAGLWLPLGLSPYAYLIVSSLNPQPGSWGDLSSMRGVVRHVLREEYGTLRLGIAPPNAEGALERIIEYVFDSTQQTMFCGPLLALLGIAWSFWAPTVGSDKGLYRSNSIRVFGAGLLAAWAFYVIVWHSVLSNISLRHPMSRAVHARFWIQPNLLLCVAAGGGIGVVVNSVVSVIWYCWPRCCRPGRCDIAAVLSPSVTVLLGAHMIRHGWETMDRAPWSGQTGGWTMHLYGQALLSALPSRSVLLSHTDLDLNAARYLRVCEGLRTDVTHISLQMMPYPWWDTVQVKLHPDVIFPPILPDVSTRRESEGNAALVTRFLGANIRLGHTMFLDMQAVDESEIGTAGGYRGLFSLIPHGLTYRVLPAMPPRETEKWHAGVIEQLRRLDNCMQPVSTEKYRPGSWEFAAISVYWDAHYQAGLFFLSYAMAVWVNAPKEQQRKHALPALKEASALLLQTLQAADEHGTFSSSKADLLKNTVLAQVRYHHALKTKLIAARNRNPNVATMQAVNKGVSPPFDKLLKEMVRAKALCIDLIPRFLLEAEDDKDAEVFGKTYIMLRESI